MKGHIAFCPHFHQPHFQLYRTREEAYANSYEPWLRLLQDAVNLDSFYINTHFSGPFLYWMRQEKPEYVEALKQLYSTGKMGIIGGLADEPFIQLSSRPDDYLFQMREYDRLIQETIGISAAEWQGIHVVERECGEVLLRELTWGARTMQASPIFYLDQETFFPAHFSYPGSDNDYCLRHFGFVDPVSITTVSHIPPEMLYYALRDEIAGQEFFVLPVHSQFRYQLLKRQSFTSSDNTRIKPGHYYFYIKDTLEKAARLAKEYGREIEPILLIFEDAEKFGQWSKDPAGDAQWLMEFFNLVERDPDLKFTGLKDYLTGQGILDTYPISSSHSYPEWENWTARRGIRGVSFGDERLRRVMSRIRDLETLQEAFEDGVITLWQDRRQNRSAFSGELREALMQSSRRSELVSALIEEQLGEDLAAAYHIINRVRHVAYQEDPKWASRHPSYGSSPYYDAQGLAYVEVALRLMEELNNIIGLAGRKTLSVVDWDCDGGDEIVLESASQNLVVHREGGCMIYHHVLSPQLAGDIDLGRELLTKDISKVSAYHSIHRHLVPLVFTETDSSLVRQYYPEGGRREVCRNSLRCEMVLLNDGDLQPVGGFATMTYDIEPVNGDPGGVVSMKGQGIIEGTHGPVNVVINKYVKMEENKLLVTFQAVCQGEISGLALVPQLVLSAAPSDEVEFKPKAWMGMIPAEAGQDTQFTFEQLMVNGTKGLEVFNDKRLGPRPASIDYIYELRCGDDNTFNNRVKMEFASPNRMPWLKVEPAVKHYYQGYVFPDQSRLGYHTSGVMICPVIVLEQGQGSFDACITWDFDTSAQKTDYERIIDLIK
ncbi:MAG: hypothetical protein GXY34_11955 [Syntrophomonadaceae bacterium]|nr:hypothetical protein [Syntrophomonadaceae bacterium]